MDGIIITNAGFNEIVNAEANGTAPVRITQIGFGRGQYSPSPYQTELVDEFKRINTISGGVTQSGVLHVSVVDSGLDDYIVHEVGLYTESGTLFGVYTQTTPIIQKVANSDISVVVDIVLTNVNPESVTIGDANFNLAPAEKNRAGVVELATAEEVLVATDDRRAITPAALLAAFASGKPTEATGWQRMVGGMILQWGRALVVAETGTTVTFPTLFPHACRVVIGQPVGYEAPITLSAWNKTNGSVELLHNGNGGVYVDWIAIGD